MLLLEKLASGEENWMCINLVKWRLVLSVLCVCLCCLVWLYINHVIFVYIANKKMYVIRILYFSCFLWSPVKIICPTILEQHHEDLVCVVIRVSPSIGRLIHQSIQSSISLSVWYHLSRAYGSPLQWPWIKT